MWYNHNIFVTCLENTLHTCNLTWNYKKSRADATTVTLEKWDGGSSDPPRLHA